MHLKIYNHKLFDLQNMFYADGRFSLLIILQGMDTAGKDGIIRHVLSCINPMGIQVKSFLEDLPLKFPGLKKGANKPSIILQ